MLSQLLRCADIGQTQWLFWMSKNPAPIHPLFPLPLRRQNWRPQCLNRRVQTPLAKKQKHLGLEKPQLLTSQAEESGSQWPASSRVPSFRLLGTESHNSFIKTKLVTHKEVDNSGLRFKSEALQLSIPLSSALPPVAAIDNFQLAIKEWTRSRCPIPGKGAEFSKTDHLHPCILQCTYPPALEKGP